MCKRGHFIGRMLTLLPFLVLVVLVSCHPSAPRPASAAPTAATPPAPTLALTSPAFAYGAPIPVRYTCDGEDTSPPLSWSTPPPETRSLVLLVEDPDAPMGTWIHWLVYDIPPSQQALPEGVSGVGTPGRNSWQRTGYGGPCPPPGKPHRYFFRLFALDAVLSLPAGATWPQAQQVMSGHLLAQGEWMGVYGR